MSAHHTFYTEISKLRDLFHKYGRFDDSNAKLDEIGKYIAIYIHQLHYSVPSDRNLHSILSAYKQDKSFKLVLQLKEIFASISTASIFCDAMGSSIFGDEPGLNIENTDSQFACALIELVLNSVDSILQEQQSGSSFDLLNESFGHFVRDNFRNHTEDAQYMTPAEVVEFTIDLAIHDLSRENADPRSDNFIVCDPCCGVGSFLATFARHVGKYRDRGIANLQNLMLLGQDKVSRMVRLSKINMLLGNAKNHAIAHGNSIVGNSFLDAYEGQIDLILTNPPFGARFTGKELSQEQEFNPKYPLLCDLFEHHHINFDSEILLIDRSIALLKPGGKLLAVVPDSFISSTGLNATFRERLANNDLIKIRAIIELPAVTFAQAGTRTKTSIIYLERTDRLNRDLKSDYTFMATSKSIGFEVIIKKGTTFKIETGKNDLIDLLMLYRNRGIESDIQASLEVDGIVRHNPVCATISSKLLAKYSWIPSHYQAFKYDLTRTFTFKHGDRTDIELVKLCDIVDFVTTDRRKERAHPQSKCISVLHINSDRSFNYEALLSYHPKSQGVVCRVGDLLFSKINPRIPRLLVIPSLDFPLSCSPEFEILISKIDIHNYGIKLLLLLPSVQTQIQALTSGTSSSHNRIKSCDLANILLPLPKPSTSLHIDWIDKIEAYARKEQAAWQARLEVYDLENSAIELLS
jgi:type I restriction-modification system DNA methylase subunit